MIQRKAEGFLQTRHSLARYAQIEKELEASTYACERFHQYVYGRDFEVETDHKPLCQSCLSHWMIVQWESRECWSDCKSMMWRWSIPWESSCSPPTLFLEQSTRRASTHRRHWDSGLRRHDRSITSCVFWENGADQKRDRSWPKNDSWKKQHW